MKTKTLLSTVLSVAISTCLLTACGGGGSSMGMSVRPEAPPPPPPPPTGGAQPQPCPEPITGDCVVEMSDSKGQEMTGGRQSDHALIVHGDGWLDLQPGSGSSNASPTMDFRFGGGATIESGSIFVNANANMVSNVAVQALGGLSLRGTMTGNLTNFGHADLWGEVTGDVANHGYTYLWGTVTGNVVNDGILEPGAYYAPNPVSARIEGDFSQTANGTLVVVVGMDASVGTMTGGFLTVTGRADIDGTAQLVQFWDDGPAEYVALPAAPLSVHVLHADGGVFGTFDQWTSPYLFITGDVQYFPNDIYFDVSTVSAQAAMARAGADARTVRSAGNFDAALANAATWARAADATRTTTQRQFLASVGAIQRLQDYGQATRTLDSLSGSGYAGAANAVLQQAAMPAPALMARVANLRPGLATGSWATQTSMLTSSAGVFNGQSAGFDQWLGDGLLAGASFGWSEGSLRFDRAGGSARDEVPQWDVYLRHNGSGNTYVFGDVGYSRHQLDFNRRIDIGLASQSVGATRDLGVMRAYLEAGRDFRIGRMQLTPFGAVSYAVLEGAGFVEQGNTGFELMVQPSTQQRLSAATGVRLGSAWHSRDGRWTTLNLTAGYRQLLHANDNARAAYTGTPDVAFALSGLPLQRNTGWMQMNLATGNERWNWLLSYDRQDRDQAMSLGASFRF